jgi:hypothetical protein
MAIVVGTIPPLDADLYVGPFEFIEPVRELLQAIDDDPPSISILG